MAQVSLREVSVKMIVFRNVSKCYQRGRPALSCVNLTVRRGECVGLLGPNGAGKSTLTRLLLGTRQDFEGCIEVDGSDVRSGQRAAKSIGYVAQSDWLDPYALVRQELAFQAELRKTAFAPSDPYIAELLQDLGLSEELDSRVMALSGGTKRRLTLCLALLHRPSVLVLDEPTNGLDPEVRTGIWRRLVRDNRERGLTVLVATHALDEVEQHCGRAIVLCEGRTIADQSPAEMKGGIGAGVLTIRVDGGAAMTSSMTASILRRFEPLQPFLISDKAIKFAFPEGGEIGRMREAALRASDADALGGAVVSWGRVSLEDAYLKSLSEHEGLRVN